METVKQVLEYLLEHDVNEEWRIEFTDIYQPFLCNRIGIMVDRGLIDEELGKSAIEFIESKLTMKDERFQTLCDFHYEVTGSPYIGAPDKAWPSIRQSYLRKWIEELGKKA